MTKKKKDESAPLDTDEVKVDGAELDVTDETVPEIETDVDDSAVEAVEATDDPVTDVTEEATDTDMPVEETLQDSVSEDDAPTDADDAPDIEDAEVVEADPEVAEADAPVEPVVDDVVLPNADGAADHVAPAEVEEASAPTEPPVVDLPEPEPKVIEKTVVEKRGGVLPGLLGGIAAGLAVLLLGPGLLPEGMRPITDTTALDAQIAAQAVANADLEARVKELTAALEAAPGNDVVAAIEDRITTAEGGLADIPAAIQSAIAEAVAANETMLARIDELEKRPIAEATDPAAVSALQAFEREVAALREDVTAQMNRAEGMVEEAALAAKAAQEQALADAAAAKAAALAASQQQAIADIKAALDAGEPFADKLAALEGADIPAELSAHAADGVMTLAALQAAISDPARAALDTARRSEEAADYIGERGRSFLLTQLGVRSLAPRDGDGPDAVLSRVEAAAREGRLEDAVAEIANLPESAQAPLAAWAELALARAGALVAAEALATSLNAAATN